MIFMITPDAHPPMAKAVPDPIDRSNLLGEHGLRTVLFEEGFREFSQNRILRLKMRRMRGRLARAHTGTGLLLPIAELLPIRDCGSRISD